MLRYLGDVSVFFKDGDVVIVIRYVYYHVYCADFVASVLNFFRYDLEMFVYAVFLSWKLLLKIANNTLKRSCCVFSKSIRAGFLTRIVKVAAFSATEGEISKVELSPSRDKENIPLWPLKNILKK